MSDQILFSVIRPEFKQRLFKRAMLTGLPGITLLLCMGALAPVEIVSRWGILAFGVGMFLIGWGMIPYRKLSRLEINPHRIELFKHAFAFVSSGGGVIEFPYAKIEAIEYLEKRYRYGIRIRFKGGKMFFFPYFTNNTF